VFGSKGERRVDTRKEVAEEKTRGGTWTFHQPHIKLGSGHGHL